MTVQIDPPAGWLSSATIAEKFGCSLSQVTNLCRRHKWERKERIKGTSKGGVWYREADVLGTLQELEADEDAAQAPPVVTRKPPRAAKAAPAAPARKPPAPAPRPAPARRAPKPAPEVPAELVPVAPERPSREAALEALIYTMRELGGQLGEVIKLWEDGRLGARLAMGSVERYAAEVEDLMVGWERQHGPVGR